MLAIAAVVFDEKQRILLNKRDKDPDKGRWQLFATYVRPGERLTEAVRRRLRENAGISDIASIEFTGLYSDEPGRHEGTCCIPFIFKAFVDGNTPIAAGCEWFDADKVQDLEMALDNKETLRKVL